MSPPPAEQKGLLTSAITQPFATGKLGMQSANSGALGRFFIPLIGNRFEWDVMPVPKAPRTKRSGGFWNDQPHVVTSNAQKRGVLNEAASLVTFLAGDDVQRLVARDRGSTPTTKAIQESEDYLKPPPASMRTIIDELGRQKSPQFFTRYLEWTLASLKQYELGLLGEQSVEDTIKNMVIEGDKVLAQR